MGTVVFVILMNGCATYGGYIPQIDYSLERNPQMVQQDQLECRQLAQSQSSTGAETAKGAGVGALIGGGAGAAIGALIGNPGQGAALGAMIGGFGGGTYQGMGADNSFKNAYNACMINRGHKVVR